MGISACILAFGVEGERVFKQKIEGGRPAPGTLPEARGVAPESWGYENLPARLTLARGALTQRALAKKSSLSHTAIGNIEAERAVPGVDAVESLAAALGVSPCWLAYGVGQGPE